MKEIINRTGLILIRLGHLGQALTATDEEVERLLHRKPKSLEDHHHPDEPEEKRHVEKTEAEIREELQAELAAERQAGQSELRIVAEQLATEFAMDFENKRNALILEADRRGRKAATEMVKAQFRDKITELEQKIAEMVKPGPKRVDRKTVDDAYLAETLKRTPEKNPPVPPGAVTINGKDGKPAGLTDQRGDVVAFQPKAMTPVAPVPPMTHSQRRYLQDLNLGGAVTQTVASKIQLPAKKEKEELSEAPPVDWDWIKVANKYWFYPEFPRPESFVDTCRELCKVHAWTPKIFISRFPPEDLGFRVIYMAKQTKPLYQKKGEFNYKTVQFSDLKQYSLYYRPRSHENTAVHSKSTYIYVVEPSA